jgi:hypothetical protein
MRGSYLVLSTVAVALVLGGCSGGNQATPNAAAPAQYAPTGSRVVDSGIAKPRLLRLMHTPNHPPPRKHRITSAERARARAGGWQQIVASAPWTNGPDTPMQMTDGTVLVHDYCTPNWYSLAPDSSGSYLNGTWTKVASMPSNYGPLYFASAVLADGKLVVNGGEYNGATCQGVETNLGAIYDPVANSWTAVAGPSGWSEIGDAQSVVLSNGTYMIGNCCYTYQALFNEGTLTWTQTGPGNGKHDENSEEGWALLPGGNVLAVDVASEPAAEVYNRGSNAWSAIAPVGFNLTAGFEIGPSTLRPNGTVFVAGASGLTGIYNTKTGVWTQGPSFPIISGQQYDVADGPSSLLTDGDVMVPASPGLYNAPALFYRFDGTNLKQIAAPPDAPNDSSYNIRLMMLPTGQVLEVDSSSDVEIYTPGRSGGGGHAPQITNVPTSLNPGSTYKITGRRFNGISQANMYGDDAQEATNYPLVRITNNGTGHVVYCRTHGTTFMGVASNKKVSTMFDVPASIGTGAASLVVVANGIASAPVSVTIP